MSKLPVSVLIIAQNAAFSLRRCLDSLSDFEEVVLVDGGSTDETLQIAQEYANVVVHQNAWPGFIAQRNFSIDCATKDWCFMLDSDEAVTPELVQAMAQIIKEPNPKKMYRVVRTEYFEGQAIEYGHGRSNYQERLFQTKHIRYTGGNHHEHLVDGRLLHLGDPDMGDLPFHLRVLHWPKYDFAEWIKKMPRFVTLVAEEKLARGKKASLLIVIFTLFGTFIQIYGKSWRQGRLGFVIAIRESCYRTLVKLYMYCKTTFQPKKEDAKDFERQFLN